VTIVAGFKCYDGIVLCADTEETFGNAKTKVPKLRICPAEGMIDHSEDLMLALAGAGDGPFVDKLVELIWAKVQTATSFDEACEFSKQAIEEAHQKFGAIFQPGLMPEAKFVYGLKMDGRSKLFSSVGPIVNEQTRFAIHGCGDELGTYIYSLMSPSWAAHSLPKLAILAQYIVFQAKEHVPGVGGGTHLGVLRNEGNSSSNFALDNRWMEDHFHYLDGFLGEAFLSVFDIDTPDHLADIHLRHLTDMLQLGRKEMKEWREKAVAFMKKMKEMQEKRDRENYPWKYRKSESETMPSDSQK
jgi:hypothetical protein